MAAAAGCFYAQYFLFIDARIAYGPWISIEALLAPIIGGVGTVFGPLLGALMVKILGEAAKHVTGDVPGLDLVVYGVVLILVVGFAPRGVAGICCATARHGLMPPAEKGAGGRAWLKPILAVEGISKRFGGLHAVRDASLTVEAGRITAVIGPNGAGKTTLFALITGFLTPTGGRIVYKGADITGMPAHRLARQGIARTFQIVQPFAGLSVLENIAVGAHLHIAGRTAALAAAADVARPVGLEIMLHQPAATLTVAGRKRLELARALATSPKLLLLDEVLAGLNPSEIRDMVPMIRAIRERGVTIMMIEHVMQAVMSLAEQIYVLVEGHVIAQGPPATVAAESESDRGLSRRAVRGQASRRRAHGPLRRFAECARVCTPATARSRSCAESTGGRMPATSSRCSARMARENRHSTSRFPGIVRHAKAQSNSMAAISMTQARPRSSLPA